MAFQTHAHKTGRNFRAAATRPASSFGHITKLFETFGARSIDHRKYWIGKQFSGTRVDEGPPKIEPRLQRTAEAGPGRGHVGMALARSTQRRMTVVVVVAAASVLLAACSSSSSGTYPSLFAEPPQRGDTPLTPDEVKQATDTLLTYRQRLCADAIANVPPGGPPPDCATQAGKP